MIRRGRRSTERAFDADRHGPCARRGRSGDGAGRASCRPDLVGAARDRFGGRGPGWHSRAGTPDLVAALLVQTRADHWSYGCVIRPIEHEAITPVARACWARKFPARPSRHAEARLIGGAARHRARSLPATWRGRGGVMRDDSGVAGCTVSIFTSVEHGIDVSAPPQARTAARDATATAARRGIIEGGGEAGASAAFAPRPSSMPAASFRAAASAEPDPRVDYASRSDRRDPLGAAVRAVADRRAEDRARQADGIVASPRRQSRRCVGSIRSLDRHVLAVAALGDAASIRRTASCDPCSRAARRCRPFVARLSSRAVGGRRRVRRVSQ